MFVGAPIPRPGLKNRGIEKYKSSPTPAAIATAITIHQYVFFCLPDPRPSFVEVAAIPVGACLVQNVT